MGIVLRTALQAGNRDEAGVDLIRIKCGSFLAGKIGHRILNCNVCFLPNEFFTYVPGVNTAKSCKKGHHEHTTLLQLVEALPTVQNGWL